MASKMELLDRAEELGLAIPKKVTTKELEKMIEIAEERIVQQEQAKRLENRLLERFDWFDLKGSEIEKKKDRNVVEVHVFDGIKKYGFEKIKEKIK